MKSTLAPLFATTISLCVSIQGSTFDDTAKTAKIESKTLHVPPLDELKTVLGKALSKNYADVKVGVVDCPNLQEPPFNLVAPGLGGNTAIFDIGGPNPEAMKFSKLYDLKTVHSRAHLTKEKFIIGAAQGPLDYFNKVSEMAVNMILDSETSRSIVALLDTEKNTSYLQEVPANLSHIAFVGNLLVSEGKPGKVLEIHVRKRTGDKDNLADYIHRALADYYTDQLVSLGGTFVSLRGKVRHHVVEPDIRKHLKFVFSNLTAPVISVGTITSSKSDLKLSRYHFHSFSDHQDGGHYHNDVSPNEIEYIGYFTPGRMIFRVDAPRIEFQGGVDGLVN